MEQWKSDLIDKILASKVQASNGKYYLECPNCGCSEFEDKVFSDDGSTFETQIRPAFNLGKFVYIESKNCYAECGYCDLCMTHWYVCDIKNKESVVFIKHDDIEIDPKYVFGQMKCVHNNSNPTFFINSAFDTYVRKIKGMLWSDFSGGGWFD